MKGRNNKTKNINVHIHTYRTLLEMGEKVIFKNTIHILFTFKGGENQSMTAKKNLRQKRDSHKDV